MNTIPYLTGSSVLDRAALDCAVAYSDVVDGVSHCLQTGLDLVDYRPLRFAGYRILVQVACSLPVSDDLVVEIRVVGVPREKNFLCLFQNY